MTIPDLAETYLAIPALTPIQEKVIFGVDIPQYAQQTNTGITDDSTISILSKLKEGDKEFTKTWLKSKTIQSQSDYAILVLVLVSQLSKPQDSEGADETNKMILDKLCSIELKSLPTISNIVAWNGLDDISKHFSETSFKSCTTLDSFTDKFKHLTEDSSSSMSNILYFYFGFNHFKYSPNELEKNSLKLKTFLDSSQKQCKFPTATQSNSKEVDQLMILAIYLTSNSDLFKDLDLYQTINRYIYVTYQNVRVMKMWCVNSINLGFPNEIRSTFKTYLNYVSDYKIKNNGEYYDLLDVIHTYVSVLEKLSLSIPTIADYNELQCWFKEVEELMQTFMHIVGDSHVFHLEPLKEMLASTYFSFSMILENFLKMEVIPINKTDEIIKYLGKSIDSLNNTDKSLKLGSLKVSMMYYKYSFYLHKSNNNVLAIANAKHAIKHSPDNVKYINYYVKLLSGEEGNLDNILLILQQVIEKLHESSIDEESYKWSFENKRDALESYLLFLTLLGSSAIDALAPFFGFVNKIFENQHDLSNALTSTSEKTRGNITNNVRSNKIRESNINDEACAPCAPNSKTVKERKIRHVLNPLKHISATSNSASVSESSSKKIGHSIRKSLEVKRLGHKVQNPNMMKTNNIVKNSTKTESLTVKEIILLRNMWLTISKIFQGLDDNQTALECVEEANKYSAADMMKNASQNQLENQLVLNDKVEHKCAINARKGSILTGMEIEKLEDFDPLSAKSYLEIAIGISDIHRYPTIEGVNLVEAIVSFTQLSLKAVKDSKIVGDDKQEWYTCISRCRKHLEAIVETVSWNNDALCWLLLSDVYSILGETTEKKEMEIGDFESECIIKAVHGWHGLRVLNE